MGHPSYLMAIYSRTDQHQGCPECSKYRQTSFSEKAIFYFIHAIDDSAIENYKDKENGITELDIYLPKRHIGIEYDGKRYHGENKRELDEKNHLIVKKQGYNYTE